MGNLEKLTKRLLSKPKDFTYAELVGLLTKLGYEEDNVGKTSGSRKAFIRNQHIIRIHKPHPGNEVKGYVIKIVIEELKKENLI